MGSLLRFDHSCFEDLVKGLRRSATVRNVGAKNMTCGWSDAYRKFLMFAVSLTLMMSFSFPVQAAEMLPTPTPIEPSVGEKVFTANCAACHIGGNNVILAEKNLSKDALSKYGMDSIAAIKTQVTGGKNAMPAFGDDLSGAEIEAVARYVLMQSQQEWKGSSVGLH